MKYHIRLIYIDENGERIRSEFDVDTIDAVNRVMVFMRNRPEWVFVFMTVQDNTTKTRLQGARSIATFYTVEATDLLHAAPFTPVLKSYMHDLIYSHGEVMR